MLRKVFPSGGKKFLQAHISYKPLTLLANTFTYGNMSTNGSYTTWTDINPQAFSNCVDMVFLVDRTASMNSYLPGIENIVSNLPTNGESCINRYVIHSFLINITSYTSVVYGYCTITTLLKHCCIGAN